MQVSRVLRVYYRIQ